MPYGGNFHISKALSNYAINYKNTNYILKDFPAIPVKKESDLYYVHTRDFRIPETYRANKSPSNQKTWAVSTSSYTLTERALKDLITDRDKANSDVLQLERETTEMLTDDIMRALEFEASSLLFTTTTWANNASLASTTSWLYHTTTSVPIQNILSGTSRIIQVAGVRPNTLIMGNRVFDALKENTAIHERIKYTERSVYTEQLLSSVFDVDRVIVGFSVYDPNKEGETESVTSIWGDNALLCYLSPSPSMRDVSAFKQFELQGGIKIKRWRDEEYNGDWIEASTMQITKACATQSAYYFSSCTS